MKALETGPYLACSRNSQYRWRSLSGENLVGNEVEVTKRPDDSRL